ncbi:HSPB1-associated protein 1 [Protopterus annectens]|uniref:HSPB1-associated protein 1 n=1 Tax=Protopterus annectens TaxID=7888 RepID=UPI001CFA7B08|nr:HSPB1-associated protein 1 [Protopterus annectens]
MNRADRIIAAVKLQIGNRSKPFTSEEAYEIVMSLQQPAVFWSMASDWPALQWTVENLSWILDEKPIRFRLGSKKTETAFPLFENHCSFLEASMMQFLSWSQGLSDAVLGPFSSYPYSEFWAYADYKYIAMLFEDKKEHFKDVVWSDFGFPGRDGKDSTLWIGTEGANTPCHLDCYGCNLVLQVQGRPCQ